MKITIELKSGKKLKLTTLEVTELLEMFNQKQTQPITIYPTWKTSPYPYPYASANPLIQWTYTTCGSASIKGSSIPM